MAKKFSLVMREMQASKYIDVLIKIGKHFMRVFGEMDTDSEADWDKLSGKHFGMCTNI